jgi:hypothetical protein
MNCLTIETADVQAVMTGFATLFAKLATELAALDTVCVTALRAVTVPAADGKTSLEIDLMRVTVDEHEADTVTKKTLMACAIVEEVQATMMRLPTLLITETAPEHAARTLLLHDFRNDTAPDDAADTILPHDFKNEVDVVEETEAVLLIDLIAETAPVEVTATNLPIAL